MADTFHPGDIWRHNRMGGLVVTGEPGCKPGYLKCYWTMGGNPMELQELEALLVAAKQLMEAKP